MPTSVDSATAATLKGRTLVLCFDGTSNQYDGENTNVVKFYSLLKKDAAEQQLCYYQPGIGTYFQPGVVAPLFQWCAKILDEAVAWYLGAHVRGGYSFLMQNWRPGDKICIFGFSRGAYTARALAGFIHKIGLLPKDNPEQVPLAYKMFTKTDPQSVQLAAGFKQTFCRSVQIEFVGVWDTVASVGVLMSKTLPFTTTNTTIKTFRHALALDERRAKFRPNLYHRLSPNATRTVQDLQAELGIDDLDASSSSSDSSSPTSPSSIDAAKKLPTPRKSTNRSATQTVGTPPGRVHPRGKGDARRPFPNVRHFLRRGSHKRAHEEKNFRHDLKHRDMSAVDDPSDDFVGLTDVLEVWFCGGHGNVGGGSTPNTAAHALSDIPLRWMVRQVVAAQCGVQFDNDAISRAGIPASTILGPAFVTSDFVTDSASPATDSPQNTAYKKFQPTLHFFTEPEEKKEGIKRAAAAAATEPSAGGPSEIKPVQSVTGSTVKAVFGTGEGNGLSGGTPAADQSKDAKGKEKQGDKHRRSEESEASIATNSTGGTDIDAVQPINDELTNNKWWWILEIIPTNYTYQDGQGRWHTKWGFHLGKGRNIPDFHPNFHESVKERMESKELKYKPRATWTPKSEVYVS